MLKIQNVKLNQKGKDFSGYLTSLMSNGVNSALDDIKNEIDSGIKLNLKEGNYSYDFFPVNIKYNSDNYFVINGKMRENNYDLYMKLNNRRLQKCFLQGDDFILNLDKIYY